ncbi:hypothetical protein EJ06DRAFT_530803 [Trichodelitschia bisporula]|uniref:Uncharacterized protein n=1 Tax=Trichodelitschia bisporula TaxID=703511 RepID=A0A6G1HVF4_9PEZI|nr:hypothetical protein EJ06DRAFT_530803 [Trichodelitschia bisporula]
MTGVPPSSTPLSPSCLPATPPHPRRTANNRQLLSSPLFHRGVQKIHKSVHNLRHGTPLEEMGGTKIERNGPSYLAHFKKELKEQLGLKK